MTLNLPDALQAFVPKLTSQLQAILSPQHVSLEAALSYSTLLGGKRFRPFLASAIGSYLGVPESQSLRIGAAIELVHTYSLVHDDLPAMDNADHRRGHLSCHKKFDEATAILVGDGLLTLAFEVLAAAETHPDPAIRCKLVTTLAQASGATGMVAGQMLDMRSDVTSLQDLDRLHQLKSGALITASCLMPAHMAGASPDELTLWQRFGEALGLAFQITDDILDETSDPATLGKPTHQDTLKTTYVSLIGLDKAKARAQDLLTDALEVLEKFRLIRHHSDAYRDEFRSLLGQLAHYVVERHY